MLENTFSPSVQGGRRAPHLPSPGSGTGTTGTGNRAPDDEPGSGAAVGGVDLHGAGDGLEGAVPEVVERLLVQELRVVTEAAMQQVKEAHAMLVKMSTSSVKFLGIYPDGSPLFVVPRR
ncbi:hypothetical protein EYF80_047237 [Liparis tanakae]|uniref:Uncharacterized protein n=1 Tax=Liparis tanakae TaxID=230148 RepID=A0A4Z2FN47_9TELE|nr:hypothetical protein EYF80_047237 [Liparis tanakae]